MEYYTNLNQFITALRYNIEDLKVQVEESTRNLKECSAELAKVEHLWDGEREKQENKYKSNNFTITSGNDGIPCSISLKESNELN